MAEQWCRFRCATLPEPPFLSPPCEGGARGGGPASVESTMEAALARSIDNVDRACAASPACKTCRFRTSLRANGEYTDDAEVLRPTPPAPPFTRGGKVSATARMCATKAFLWRRAFPPSQHQHCAAPGCRASRHEPRTRHLLISRTPRALPSRSVSVRCRPSACREAAQSDRAS